MKYRWLFGVFLSLGIALFVSPAHVVAVCGTCTNGTCVNCSYTTYYNCGVYPAPIDSQQCSTTVPDLCCQLNTSLGNCQYCDTTDTCYYDGCAVPPPGGPGPDSGVPTNTPVPTPATPVTLEAVVVQVSLADTSCTAIQASATGVPGTVFGFTASSANQPTPLTQTGATPVSFTGQPPGWYTLTDTPPNANWVAANACAYRNGTLVSLGWTVHVNGGDTIRWELGYTFGTAWAQTEGGDVYASGTLRSFVPSVSPRVFNGDGSGLYPGVVTYGTICDFDSDSFYNGCSYVNPPGNPHMVSSTNWLVQATRTMVNYYDLFYHRFGAPTITDNDLFPALNAVSQPASRTTPYYITGDMTTLGDWSVGSGQSIVFLVNGNLTIGGNINIVPNSTGFIAFIVNGNITVDSAVGTTVASTSPVMEGVYITSPTGTIQTGTSLAASTARLVGKGMFISGNFLLQRDLDTFGGNTTHAAELFLYNPQLLLTMPDLMKELPVTWQEVAP